MKDFDKQWEQFIFVLLVLLIAFVVGRILRYVMGRFVKASALKMKVDPTRYNFFKNAVDFVVFLIAIILIFRSIPALHALSTTLITGAGVLAAIVGFASQAAFSNIISGIFLVIFRPFSVGDRIKVGQTYTGDVEDITLRHTVIRNFENTRIIIPNAIISTETITNYNSIDERVIVYLEVVITFESDINTAFRMIQEEAMKHPLYIDNRSAIEINKGDAAVVVRVLGFTDTGVQIRGSVWARSAAEGFELKCDVLKSLKEKFNSAGIDIAGIHRLLLPPGYPLKA
jgi:small conductance mechanosensitive channel